MEKHVQEWLENIQRQLHSIHGQKVDVYRVEGKGTIVIPHGYPLIPQFAIVQIPDELFGQQITITKG